MQNHPIVSPQYGMCIMVINKIAKYQNQHKPICIWEYVLIPTQFYISRIRLAQCLAAAIDIELRTRCGRTGHRHLLGWELGSHGPTKHATEVVAEVVHHIWVYTYIHIYVCVYIYIYIYMCVLVYVYVCSMYMCKCIQYVLYVRVYAYVYVSLPPVEMYM